MVIGVRIYDFLETLWLHRLATKVISTLLISSFIGGLVLVAASKYSTVEIPWFIDSTNYFFAIDLSLQILLIIEVVGLIFALPKSVADSIGKQFEILSIILLRSAFKEFGKFDHPVQWSNLAYDLFFHMLVDAFGALLIFLIIGFYYKKQRHARITENEDEQKSFVSFKKILALMLIGIFIFLGIFDLFQLGLSGKYNASFSTFYTVLIFTDILILLYSLRYSTRYYNLFRFSSFAFATILIRIALTAPPYINVGLGVIAGLFVLGLTVMYNYFIESKI